MNGDGYAVDWSVPISANRSSRSSGTPGRAAQPVPALGMEASLVDVDGQTTVTVRGELDIATAGAFWATLERATLAGSTLVIDLSGTRFMDSSGLHVLVRARGQLAAIGSTIVLRSTHERVMKVLEISGLDRIFTIELDPGPNGKDSDLTGPGEREGQRPV